MENYISAIYFCEISIFQIILQRYLWHFVLVFLVGKSQLGYFTFNKHKRIRLGLASILKHRLIMRISSLVS